MILVAGCAPTIDGPIERQRTRDRTDGEAVAAQLSALPGVVRCAVVLRRPARDPLAVAPPSPATTTVVVIVDDHADSAAIAATTRSLARAASPEVDPVVVVELGAIRPTLAALGPFTVEAGSRAPLRAVLAITLALVAALAAWIAIRERRRA